MFELFLGAALKVFVDVLRDAGKGYISDELRGLLARSDDAKLRTAFKKAHKTALSAASDSGLKELLDERSVREQIMAGLLDVAGLDVPLIMRAQPEHARALGVYFRQLKNGLLVDTTFGPVLERFEEVQFRAEVMELLKQQPQLQPGSLVRDLNAELQGARAVTRAGEITIAAGGNYQNIEQLIQVVVQKAIGGATQDENLRRRYLNWLINDANLLPWAQVKIEFARPDSKLRFGLADVYTNLDTTEMRGVREEADLRRFMRELSEKERVPAQEMLNNERLLLIMGDPGSGKSTFVKHLTYVLAQANVAEQPKVWLNQIEPWRHGAAMPVRLELRRFAEFVDPNDQGSAKQIFGYLRSLLDEWQLRAYADELIPEIMDEQTRFLIMLDGLDEVPLTQRQTVVDATQDIADRYPKHRYLVTCRPYAWIGQPWKLTGFKEVTLAPFSHEQMLTFVENWYGRLATRREDQDSYLSEAEARDKADELKIALERPDLRRLAERPLLLTVTTQLHTFRGKLPQDRTELYSDAVDLLFERWQGRLGKEEGVLAALDIDKLKRSDLESGLFAVAFKAHSRATPEQQTADIECGNLVHWLTPYLGGSRDKAAEFVTYIHERAGLLIAHKTDQYTFPHRTFQEFMAACHLATLPDYATKATELVRQDFDRWREVFVLAAGYCGRRNLVGAALGAVNTLCPRDVGKTKNKDRETWLRAQLAAEALLEIGLVGVRREETGQALLERLREWHLTALGAHGKLALQDRARSGVLLAGLVDQRDEVLSVDAMQFCPVPAGAFLMGSDKKHDKYAQDDELLHEVDLPAVHMARFPVTRTQFAVFVDDHGYQTRHWWTEAGWQWRQQDKVDGPERYGDPFDLDNHPVVGVSWYECLAFCNWLDDRWRRQGWLPDDLSVCLPSEAEWEKAARGGLQLPRSARHDRVQALPKATADDWRDNKNPARIHPWAESAARDGHDPDLLNGYESEVGATSAVGTCPDGGSPYGCEEMLGNVWEWTRSKFEGYKYQPEDGREDLAGGRARVLRGGAFFYSPYGLRCAYRFRGPPNSRYYGIGFRVALAHSSDL